MINSESRTVIHPEDKNDVTYWTRKWGVSRRQIFDAILETGTIDRIAIKERLRKKGQLHFFPKWLYKLVKVL